MHNWARFALGPWTLVQAGLFKTTMDIEAIYFFTYTHTRATGMLTSCTYMYLIKGFGFILIVNCLLHPLLIFLVHYASAVISSAPPPVSTSISTMTRGLGFLRD